MYFEVFSGIVSSYWLLILLFFVIAVLYSSVGFGGGSGYLAVLVLSGIAYTQIRSTALLCNIAVVTGNVFLCYRRGIYRWKKVLPLVFFSVPLSFLGGFLKISESLFFILLGFTLLFASVLMWISKHVVRQKSDIKKTSIIKNVSYGGVIGFFSGMVGIGGGIFLAPLLHFTHWDFPKKIAATASLFILVNSVSGLAGQYFNPNFEIDWWLTLILLITVFLGGQIGNRLSHRFFSPILLKRITAILIAFVSVQILKTHL